MDSVGDVVINGAKLRRFEIVVRNLLQNDQSVPSFYKILPERQPASCSTSKNVQQNKLQQVESMMACLELFLNDGHTVVDFGCGSGHLCIALAMRRPNVLVVAVDIKNESLEILYETAKTRFETSTNTNANSSSNSQKSTKIKSPPELLNDNRVKPTYIANLFTFHGSVQSFQYTFDIAVALHLCGEATDLVLRQACRHGAAIVAAPCCVGKLSTTAHNPYIFQTTGQNAPTISYPQSKTFLQIMQGNKADQNSADWNALAKAADYSNIDYIRTTRNAVRRTAKALLERDRQLFLKEAYGYESILTRMQPWEVTPKNDILIAWHPKGLCCPSQTALEIMRLDDECAKDLLYAHQHLCVQVGKPMVVDDRSITSLLLATKVDWSAFDEENVQSKLLAFCNEMKHSCDPFSKELVFSNCHHRKLVHAVAERMELLHWTRNKKDVVVSVPIVTRDTATEYQRNGVVVLRKVITSDQIALLKEGIDWNMANPSDRTIRCETYFEDFCNWERIPQYQHILMHSWLPRIAAKLMDSKIVRLYHDHVLVKEAGTEQHTPWHQDQPYYNISGDQNVTFWVPVDPVPKEYSLQFVPGSHIKGKPWYIPRTFVTKEAKWFPEGTLPEIPIIDQSAIVSWALEPGDIVAFHMQTIHGSAGSQKQRRVVAARYIGDDVRHAPRSWRTSPEFPTGLKERLDAGSVMDDPLFPIVFPKSKMP